VTWIAEELVIFMDPGGASRRGRIAIGLPELVNGYEGRCAVSLEGLEPGGSPDRVSTGEGTLQALVLALRLAGMRLHDFQVRGGRVLDPQDGSDLPLTTIFGPLLAYPK
jgi:hypothetical protein